MKVVLDPRVAGVTVPPEWKHTSGMTLDIGLNLPRPIRGLAVRASGVCGTFAFGASEFRCMIPWSAVERLIASERFGVVLPPCALPETLASERATAVPKMGRPKKSGTAKERMLKTGLRVVK